MAWCIWCEQEMEDEATVSCTGNTEVGYPDGTILPSVPYDGEQRCHDCKIKPSGFHHLGCGMERCPKCGGQLISCGCLNKDKDE